MKLNRPLIWLIYLLAVFYISYFTRDVSDQFSDIDLFKITFDTIKNNCIYGDPVTFLTAAEDMANNGWISDGNQWVFNLWPPGFVILEAIIFSVFGRHVPVVLALLVLSCVLYATLLLVIHEFLNTRISKILSIFIPIIIFLFPLCRFFLLQPMGLIFGETFAIGFFLIGFFYAFKAMDLREIKWAIFSGVAWGLSAYFRSQFEFIINCLTILGIIAIIHLGKDIVKNKKNFSSAKLILIILISTHLIMLPWRTYHLISQGKPFWVVTQEYTAQTSVTSSEDLIKNNGAFVVDGGGNLTCILDPSTCGDLKNASKLMMKTYLNNIVKWYSIKSSLISKYWFSSIKNIVTPDSDVSKTDYFLNFIFIFIILLSFSLLIIKKLYENDEGFYISWVAASLFLAYFAIFTFAHFESRYFYFPKIMSVVLLIVILSLLSSKSKN